MDKCKVCGADSVKTVILFTSVIQDCFICNFTRRFREALAKACDIKLDEKGNVITLPEVRK